MLQWVLGWVVLIAIIACALYCASMNAWLHKIYLELRELRGEREEDRSHQ